MSAMFQDLRHAFRSLRLSGWFTAGVVTVFALAIGANAVVFAIFDTVLIRPLPYERPADLFTIETKVSQTTTERQSEDTKLSYPNFVDLRANNQVFTEVVGSDTVRFTLKTEEGPEPVWGTNVSSGFWDVFRVRPALGSVFPGSSFAPSANQIVVLSDRLWKSRFHGRPEVIGRTISLDGASHVVVGVLPADFSFPEDLRTDFKPKGRTIDLIRPLAPSPWMLGRAARWLDVTARLKPGLTARQAESALETIARGLEMDYPANRDLSFSLTSLQTRLGGEARPLLISLLAAVSLVMLIACANVAGLFLARGTGREREWAIRAALGASRGRLLRPLLAESVLVALAGGAVGLLLADFGCTLVDSFCAQYGIRLVETHVDARVTGFTFALAAVAGLLAGLSPAIRLSGKSIWEASIRDGSLVGSSGPTFGRKTLLVVQVALSVVLLAGAGLLANSFLRLWTVDPGFEPARVLSLTVPLDEARYPDGARQRSFYRQLLERISGLPGVERAGVVSGIPLGSERSHPRLLSVEGQTDSGSREISEQEILMVSPDYFRTMRVPLTSGRFFTSQDDEDATKVALINEAMARRYWGQESPVGARLRVGDSRLTVVGVVGDMRRLGLNQPPTTELYVPYLQTESCSRLSLVLRTSGSATGVVQAVKGAVSQIDPNQRVDNLQTMDQALSSHLATRRVTVLSSGGFATLALVLAATGLYGFISYLVLSRRRELGIRLALGARPTQIVRLVLGTGARIVLAGLAIGGAVALHVTRFLTDQLYGVKPDDAWTLCAVGLFLLAVAMFACFVPARRVTRVDPVSALRSE
jgi:predicted permease